MEDISGKKFSLQDWVMRRAANQSGGVVSPIIVRHGATMINDEAQETIKADVKSVSNGGVVSSSGISEQPSLPPLTNTPQNTLQTPQHQSSATQNSLQQLQIVRLLSDLGDRLRQSEKEREILWKEVETCRKQIVEMNSELGGQGNKNDKAYALLENQVKQRENLISALLVKQESLETKIEIQAKELEESRQSQEKMVEKISSIEVATGSAIVRAEDAISENNKLSKKIDALGQERARLLHKLEIMEETLTQTQESLRAKALVLLTDSALAARTNLPQTPAFTGNDTIKFSEPQKTTVNPAASINATVKPVKSDWLINTSLFVMIVACGVAAGIITKNFQKNESVKTQVVAQSAPTLKPEDKIAEILKDSGEQNIIPPMPDLAKLANQIEPMNDVTTTDVDVALEVQKKAVETFNKEIKSDNSIGVFSPDKTLPASMQDIKDIEAKAIAGNAEAQHDMAVIYSSGHGGVKVNYQKAIKWFEAAAHQNLANAQYNLAVLYHQGLGVDKDLGRAMMLYRVASSNNHPEAQYNLAIAYIDGVGTESNPSAAAYYFEQAATGGVVEAAYNLGLLHENGLLGESQPDEALFWYTLAAVKGNQDAQKSIDALKAKLNMTGDDVTKLVTRIAKGKKGFINESGVISLPNNNVNKNASVGNDTLITSQIAEYLAGIGIYNGAQNGAVSDELIAAIKQYQENNNLPVDGQVSEDILVHMLSSGAQKFSDRR